MALQSPPQYYNPYADPTTGMYQQQKDQEALNQAGNMGALQNSLTKQAGVNKNEALINALPAYGTAEGQATSNNLQASQAARMASFQALLKAVGF